MPNFLITKLKKPLLTIIGVAIAFKLLALQAFADTGYTLLAPLPGRHGQMFTRMEGGSQNT
jgi:hypothetical protein